MEYWSLERLTFNGANKEGNYHYSISPLLHHSKDFVMLSPLSALH